MTRTGVLGLDLGSNTYAVRPSTSVQLRTPTATRSPGPARSGSSQSGQGGSSGNRGATPSGRGSGGGAGSRGRPQTGRSADPGARRSGPRPATPGRPRRDDESTDRPRGPRRDDGPGGATRSEPRRYGRDGGRTAPATAATTSRACRRWRTPASLRPVEATTRGRASRPFRRRVCGSASRARPCTACAVSKRRGPQRRSAPPRSKPLEESRSPREQAAAGPVGARAVGRRRSAALRSPQGHGARPATGAGRRRYDQVHPPAAISDLAPEVADDLQRAAPAARAAKYQERLATAADALDRGRFDDARRMVAPVLRDLPEMAFGHEIAGLAFYRPDSGARPQPSWSSPEGWIAR